MGSAGATDAMTEMIMNSPEAQGVVGKMLAMGHDPTSKKNSTGFDYLETQHSDTYDFINPKQFDLKDRAVFITGASRGV